MHIHYVVLMSWVVFATVAVGEKGRSRELTSLVQKRFIFEENTMKLYAEKLRSSMYAEHLIRAQHAKSMKFKDAYMISSGQLVKEYIASGLVWGSLISRSRLKSCLIGTPRASMA
ncbi:40S ribosomal protein S3-2-like [Ipomoea triloba]|uniref:40S ribosomal protein S3-2-like n=1 Tax=Ipomoea triloba TaxID=35885 RepID=UPI00125DEC34|nr:40S ribosomal protein S3-2-like [Ipomoea triloba]